MKRHSAEEAVLKLREADEELAKGCTVAQVCQKLGVSEATYHRWRNEFGGLDPDQAKRRQELEEENQRLRRQVAELSLDKRMLQELLDNES